MKLKYLILTIRLEVKMTEEYKRPDPDELLKRIKEEEQVKERKKGYLKIFLGYVAGVGKTYRMLSEARFLKDKGL